MEHFNHDIKGKTIAIWGLSFKPNTDDMREAPSIVIINKLIDAGAIVKAYDPVALEEAQLRINKKDVQYVDDQYETILDADALIIVTEWSEFRAPRFPIMEKLMKKKVIFDGRNIYEPKEMKEFGYTYYAIGRQTYND